MAKKAKSEVVEEQAAGAVKNKTQVIRDAILAHTDKSPKEIADMLQQEGWRVKASYVSTVKFHLNNPKGGKKKRAARSAAPAAVATPAVSGDAVSLALLRKAKKLAADLGGVQQARAAINALAEIID